MDKHKKPENLEISAPKVSPEIWGVMDHFAKTQIFDYKNNKC